MKTQLKWLFGIASVSMMLTACGTAEEDKKQDTPQDKNNTSIECGAKCDTPNQAADYDPLKACEAHANFTRNSARQLFTRDAIRWACADVEGVTKQDQGQEYCEYFALVQLPDVDNDELQSDITEVGRFLEGGSRVTPFKVDLDDDQLDWLDDNSDEVVGKCVFTSWHQDIEALPCEAEGNCPSVHGDWTVNTDRMRMKVSFNSNSAARLLVRDALRALGSNAVDDFGDHYVNGCMIANTLYETEWRRSDHQVSVAAYQLGTCGCSVGDATTADEAASLIVPSAEFQKENNNGELTLRGFRLGTWSDAAGLPADCEYIQTEGSLQTMVACNVYGSDLADNSNDLKGFCRQKYAQNVVVHVPIAADAISCEIPEDATHCGEEPWVIGAAE